MSESFTARNQEGFENTAELVAAQHEYLRDNEKFMYDGALEGEYGEKIKALFSQSVKGAWEASSDELEISIETAA